MSGPCFRFLWPNSATFCQNTWKINFRFRFFSNFNIFRPPFHQLFATEAREALKILKKQLTSGGNRTTSGWKSKEIGQILETFCENTKVKPWKFDF